MADIKERVLKVIGKQLDKDPTKINEEDTFSEDLGVDSLDSVEFIMALEEEFGLEIADEEAEKIKTVKNAIDFVQKNSK